MKVLYQAIYNLFDAASDLETNTGGRMYPHEADQENATFPYVTYSLITGVADWTFTDFHEEVLFQFNIFSEENSSTECQNLFENLKTLYDDALLTVTGYTSLYMHRDTSRLIRDSQQNTWQYIADYNILLEKDRGR